MLSAGQINDGFRKYVHCSQQVLMEWAEELGYDREEASRMAAPFGGGMFRGDTCGAVAGAMIAIGLRYGDYAPGDAEGNALMVSKVKAFQKEFIARKGTTLCRELTGYDFSVDGELEKAMESGKIAEVCPGAVRCALDVLDLIM